MPLIRIITDGKAGDLTQCLGVAEAIVTALGGHIEEKIVRPRAIYALFMPWGPPDPRDEAAIAPPFPEIAIASGRRAVASLRALKRRAGAQCLTVFLKDPRSGAGSADLIWVPEHDRLRGPNVLVTLTSPHRVTSEKLVAAAHGARPDLSRLPRPRVAVLLGGPSKGATFSAKDVTRLAEGLARVAGEGASLMVTPSRRTPAAMLDAVRGALPGLPAFVWSGEGDNPYLEMLGLADALIVTADSVNMLGEAVATGRPVHAFEPEVLGRKVGTFVDRLVAHGAVAKFEGRLESLTYEPIDSTPLIAREVIERYHRFSTR